MSYQPLEPRSRRPRLVALAGGLACVGLLSFNRAFVTASSDAAPREAVEDESSSSCVVSGAWGSYRTMLNATRVTKGDYATPRGYRYPA